MFRGNVYLFPLRFPMLVWPSYYPFGRDQHTLSDFTLKIVYMQPSYRVHSALKPR